MQIRRFRRGDARKVSNIIKRCLREVNSKNYSKKIIDFMCDYFSCKEIIDSSTERKTYVALDKNKVLGTASLKHNEILAVFVNPKIHRRGVGKELMKRMENEARKSGFKQVFLWSSVTAFSFYRKLGYKKIKEKFEENFGKTLLMKKSL
jgi:N-acetylglutamate synthase-like GNAT family acetyltransferase